MTQQGRFLPCHFPDLLLVAYIPPVAFLELKKKGPEFVRTFVSFSSAALGVAAHELVHASGGVNQLGLTGKERV